MPRKNALGCGVIGTGRDLEFVVSSPERGRDARCTVGGAMLVTAAWRLVSGLLVLPLPIGLYRNTLLGVIFSATSTICNSIVVIIHFSSADMRK